jgi:hypothetical protein
LTALSCGFWGSQDGTPSEVSERDLDESRPEVTYVDLSDASRRSPFVPDLVDGRVVTKREPWRYSRALFVPDCDGDGWDDLALAGVRVSHCGHDVEGNLEIHSGRSLLAIGEYLGFAHFAPERAGREVLVVRSFGMKPSVLQAQVGIQSEPRWTRTLVGFEKPAFVGDWDRDGFEEIALGDSFVYQTRRGEELRLGSVKILAGADGRCLWTRYGEEPRGDFGMDVAPAGDRDGDGWPDVAVLAEHSISILSGATSATLVELEVSPNAQLWDLWAVGDLDGDHCEDFLCRVDADPGYVPIVYSSGSARRLDVGAGAEVLWAAPGGDLDGDGRDDLVVGLRSPSSGQQRVSVYSSAGLVDVRVMSTDDPTWTNTWGADVGRFRPGGPWWVALPVDDGYFAPRGSVLVLAGE